MRIQLWSYNYAPEPSGIAPLSTVWAEAMMSRGHRVQVVSAHPHYPRPVWGHRVRPYRESINGIDVLRLPLWIGRASAAQRVRQEASYAVALAGSSLLFPTPDVIVAVSPSFPALLPTMIHARIREVPWVLWLQDILPDGAVATGIMRDNVLIGQARRLELAAYKSARRIVVISESFRENLRAKGVDGSKVVLSYNPASMRATPTRTDATVVRTRVLTMGNIGYSQNLKAVVEAFEASRELAALGATFVLAGDGEAAPEVSAAVQSERVRVTGMLGSAALRRELDQAAVALVSQSYEGVDFNVPSKLMNFMALGIPVVASVREDSEVARLIRSSGAGWVTPCSNLTKLTDCLARVLGQPDELAARGTAGRRFAQANFTPEVAADVFEGVLNEAVADSR